MQEGSAREDLEKGNKADILLKNAVFIAVSYTHLTLPTKRIV